jgi:hypothetical protein
MMTSLVSAVACMRLLWRSAYLPPPAPDYQEDTSRGKKIAPSARAEDTVQPS